jgi:dipeptidyl-peptidase-4
VEAQSITLGKYDIDEVYGYDEKNGIVYFRAAIKDPMNKLIYSAEINTFKVTNIGPSEGYCSAVFHSNQNYLQIEHSTIATPEIHAIYDSSGTRLYTLVDNLKIWNALPEYNFKHPEFLKVKTIDNISLNAWMMKPSDFDASKKYPLILYMYGGPGSQTVLNKWNGQRYIWHQMMADKGYIIVSVDNRGTGSRGEIFNKQIYKKLGELETHDQIEMAKYFASRTFIDKDNIAAWGWSFGGYLSSMLITKGHEYFKAAVAVAPVTNWKFYDSVYTERYMDKPKNNEEGYMKTSPINYAEMMTGSLLLIHGTADDNVHYLNSVKLYDALIEGQKDVDFITIPDEAHSLPKSRQMVYTKMTEFLDSKLSNE